MATHTTIGSARVSAVLDSEGPFFRPLSEAFPSLTGDGATWRLSFRVYVVEVGDRVVVVDTGAASDTGLHASWAPVGTHLTHRLLEELELPAEQVTDVVLTHLHRDHAAGSIDESGRLAFPNAWYHVQALELDALGQARSTWDPLLVPLAASGQLRTIEGDVGLAASGDTELHLEASPGHTAGHQSLVVSGPDTWMVLAGDTFTHAAQLVEPSLAYVFDDDAARAAETRQALLARLRDRAGTLGTAHLDEAFLEVGAAPAG